MQRMRKRSKCGESAPGLASAVALVVTMGLALGSPVIHATAARSTTQLSDAPQTQWTQYQTDAPKSILELQPFRSVERVALDGAGAGRGTATLVKLNPTVNVWFLLMLDVPGVTTRTYHLENPRPLEQRPQLAMEGERALSIRGLRGSEPCEVWSAAHDPLEEAADSRLPYAPTGAAGARSSDRKSVV